MGEYHHSAHAVWDIKYHLVWITKYRYRILHGEVGERARDLLRQICAAREVRILRGAVSPDHVHMLVVVPPQLAPAKLVLPASSQAVAKEPRTTETSAPNRLRYLLSS